MAKIKRTNNDLTQKPVNNTMAKIKRTNNDLTQKHVNNTMALKTQTILHRNL